MNDKISFFRELVTLVDSKDRGQLTRWLIRCHEKGSQYEAPARQTCLLVAASIGGEILVNYENLSSTWLQPLVGRGELEAAQPGKYSISLASGLLLWEGTLRASDLLWGEAFGHSDLALAAADSEVAQDRPSRCEELLDGELSLLVFPGVDSGVIQIRPR